MGLFLHLVQARVLESCQGKGTSSDVAASLECTCKRKFGISSTIPDLTQIRTESTGIMFLTKVDNGGDKDRARQQTTTRSGCHTHHLWLIHRCSPIFAQIRNPFTARTLLWVPPRGSRFSAGPPGVAAVPSSVGPLFVWQVAGRPPWVSHFAGSMTASANGPQASQAA